MNAIAQKFTHSNTNSVLKEINEAKSEFAENAQLDLAPSIQLPPISQPTDF